MTDKEYKGHKVDSGQESALLVGLQGLGLCAELAQVLGVQPV